MRIIAAHIQSSLNLSGGSSNSTGNSSSNSGMANIGGIAGGASMRGLSKGSGSSSTATQHHVYYVPFHTVICEQILEDEHVLEHISSIGEFCLGLVPLDSDILSLEMPDMFKQVKNIYILCIAIQELCIPYTIL